MARTSAAVNLVFVMSARPPALAACCVFGLPKEKVGAGIPEATRAECSRRRFRFFCRARVSAATCDSAAGKERTAGISRETENAVRGRGACCRMMVTANGKDCCDIGDDGSGSAPAHPPRPPEFNSCFSSSAPAACTATATTAASSVPARPNMRWGLWSSQDKSWMQLVQRNYENHHRRPRPPAVAPGGRCVRGCSPTVGRLCNM